MKEMQLESASAETLEKLNLDPRGRYVSEGGWTYTQLGGPIRVEGGGEMFLMVEGDYKNAQHIVNSKTSYGSGFSRALFPAVGSGLTKLSVHVKGSSTVTVKDKYPEYTGQISIMPYQNTVYTIMDDDTHCVKVLYKDVELALLYKAKEPVLKEKEYVIESYVKLSSLCVKLARTIEPDTYGNLELLSVYYSFDSNISDILKIQFKINQACNHAQFLIKEASLLKSGKSVAIPVGVIIDRFDDVMYLGYDPKASIKSCMTLGNVLTARDKAEVTDIILTASRTDIDLSTPVVMYPMTEVTTITLVCTKILHAISGAQQGDLVSDLPYSNIIDSPQDAPVVYDLLKSVAPYLIGLLRLK